MVLRGPIEVEVGWRALWKPFFESAPGCVNAPVVQVTRAPWGYEVSSPLRNLNVTDIWRALIETRNDMVRLALQQTSEVLDLHAAVLVRDGSALLLLGPAWAGKTTLALLALREDWRYFSDDLAAIESSTGLVRPLPKPPGVKAHPWETMSHYWAPLPPQLAKPEGPFLVPPPFEGSLSERARPKWFVFLEYHRGRTATGIPLTEGEALARAGEHLGRIGPDEIGRLRAVTTCAEHWVLSYSDAVEAVGVLQDLTRGGL